MTKPAVPLLGVTVPPVRESAIGVTVQGWAAGLPVVVPVPVGGVPRVVESPASGEVGVGVDVGGVGTGTTFGVVPVPGGVGDGAGVGGVAATRGTRMMRTARLRANLSWLAAACDFLEPTDVTFIRPAATPAVTSAARTDSARRADSGLFATSFPVVLACPSMSTSQFEF